MAHKKQYIMPKITGKPLVIVRRVTVAAEYTIRSQTRDAIIDPA